MLLHCTCTLHTCTVAGCAYLQLIVVGIVCKDHLEDILSFVKPSLVGQWVVQKYIGRSIFYLFIKINCVIFKFTVTCTCTGTCACSTQ